MSWTILSWTLCHLVTWTTFFPVAHGEGRVFNFTMAFLIAIGNNGPGKLSSGAFFVALDELNNNATATLTTGDTVNFSYVFRDTRNDDVTAMRAMVDIQYCGERNNITAYIGPDVYCSNAALLATSFDAPYITFDCNDIHTLKHNMARYYMVNMEPSFGYVAKSIVALLKYYKWKSFWLVTGSGNMTNDLTDAEQNLKELANNQTITVNGITRESLNDYYRTYDNSNYNKIVQESRDKTRVYVFLGVYNSLIEFLRAVQQAGLTSRGDYVVIAAVNDKLNPQKKSDNFLRTDEWGRVLFEQSHLTAFRNMFLVTRQEPAGDTHGFAEEVKRRLYQPPINLPKPPPWFKANIKVTPEAYYLFDAVMRYGRAVLDLIRDDLNPYNATLVINKIRNTTMKSIQGFDVQISQYGESEGSYSVRSIASNESGVAPDLWQVGSFPIMDTELEYLPHSNHSVAWVTGNKPPVSDPKCGFDGAKCKTVGEMDQWKAVAIGVSLSVFVVLALGMFLIGLRHYMYEKRLDRLAWKIEYSAIKLLDDGQLRQMISPGRPRRKVQSRWRTFLVSDLTSDGELERRPASLRGKPHIRVGLYKGSHVAVRDVNRKHVELNRALKKALLTRKEMNHENINRFIGACIDPLRVAIVTQYCSRHSLQDILKNEDSPLDDMFITSLVQDLYKGMTFIHESEFGCHGHLKSSKCLVDSRWVLKIADFGLLALKVTPDATELSEEDESYCRKLLWRAPEVLREKSSQGSQKGDVYSFGIILYELYGRRGPWGDTHLNCSDIIRRLRQEDHISQPGVRPFRPDTSTLVVKEGLVPLMQACWHPDPDLRPDFKNGIRLKLKPIQQGLLKSNIFDNMLAMMEKYAHNLEAVVAERTEQLSMEKRMTENLLLRMLPRSVADRLKHGKPVAPEQYELVSIYFSDIVGFTELSAQSTPMEIVDMLNDLYTCFDATIENYDVYKVETIGDAYMVVSGLPIRNGLSHAGEIASMSLHLLNAVSSFCIRHRPDAMLKIRIGLHSGPCCAGVVGLKMPRYCLFGDTVNTASRMESTGEALKIHCSLDLKRMLDALGGYHLLERGLVDMKGKGKQLTYFLIGEDKAQRIRRISHDRLTSLRLGDRDQRCVSVSNIDYRGKIFTTQNGTVRDLGRVPECSDSPLAHDHLLNNHQRANNHNGNLHSNLRGSERGNHLNGDGDGRRTQTEATKYLNDSCSHPGRDQSFRPSPISYAPCPDTTSSLVSSGMTPSASNQTHAAECEDPSEVLCLLDDSRAKVTPETRSRTHLLHGRTPETVL